MYGAAKTVFLLGFDEEILKKVLDCVCDYFRSTTDEKVAADFFVAEEIETARSYDPPGLEGVNIEVQSRYTAASKVLSYYKAPLRHIEKLQNYIGRVAGNEGIRRDICLVYCFDHHSFLNDFYPFEVVAENEQSFLKYELGNFFSERQDIIPSYTLIYWPPDADDTLISRFSELDFSGGFFDGRYLAALLRKPDAEYSSIAPFLTLPTYIIVNQNFTPQIPL